MTMKTRARALAPLLAAALLFGGTNARADTEEGRVHFQRGVQFYKEGDFRAALIEFKRAYDAAPNYKVLYNLGQTSLELQDYASALVAFRKYLDEGGKDVPAARRAQVEGELKKLEGRVARVAVRTNLEGAEIQVDDVTVAKAPATVVVGAGRRKIAVVKAGTPPQSRMIDVAGGDDVTVDLEVAPPTTTTTNPPPVHDTTTTTAQNPPPPSTTTTEAPPPKGGGLSTATWIGIVTTGTLAVGAGVFGGLALSAKGSYDDAIATPGADARIRDARSQTRAFALTTDILAGAAIVSAGVTVVLALTTHGAPKPAADEKTASKRRVDFAVGPTGAFLAGTF